MTIHNAGTRTLEEDMAKLALHAQDSTNSMTLRG